MMNKLSERISLGFSIFSIISAVGTQVACRPVGISSQVLILLFFFPMLLPSFHDSLQTSATFLA